jgi:hypothetical protein
MGESGSAFRLEAHDEAEALACLSGMVLAQVQLAERVRVYARLCWGNGVNRSRLASVLGVSRATLYRHIFED